MTTPDNSSKQEKEQVQKELENVVEATTKHGGDSQEAHDAKEKRALAEKEVVDSRKENKEK